MGLADSMNREIAEKLMEKLVESHKIFDSAERIAMEIDDVQLREKFRMTFAKAASDLYANAMCGMFFYPDLGPYLPTGNDDE